MPNHSFFDKIIGNLDSADQNNIQACFQRISRERVFLETVFNTINEGIIVIDEKLRITYLNLAAKNLLGLPEDVEGQSISRFLKELDWNDLLGDDGEWVKTYRRELEVLYPVRRILLSYLVPFETTANKENSATLILHDVTESRERTREIIESEKMHMISLLAAGVAHEVGNPLNSLHIHLQLLKRLLNTKTDTPNSEEALELIEVANSEVERLDRIINQFLHALRQKPSNLMRCDLKPILLNCLTLVKQEIENKSVDVKCEWSDQLPSISGDETQLKQAFFNLIKNAIQAMPKGGTLEIKCDYDDKSVKLEFIDSGEGIPSDVIGKVTTPYFTSKEEGHGLGLMVVERIVREHGAELEIESSPGRGTTFTIIFPRSTKKVRLLQAPVVDEDPTRAGKTCVRHSI
ncbi:MAG: PAS domain-containing protein [Kiritimatiellaeota bacterium]|nr:PAS domain-containing protein [Kiritimatiellota bacterium]